MILDLFNPLDQHFLLTCMLVSSVCQPTLALVSARLRFHRTGLCLDFSRKKRSSPPVGSLKPVAGHCHRLCFPAIQTVSVLGEPFPATWSSNGMAEPGSQVRWQSVTHQWSQCVWRVSTALRGGVVGLVLHSQTSSEVSAHASWVELRTLGLSGKLVVRCSRLVDGGSTL